MGNPLLAAIPPSQPEIPKYKPHWHTYEAIADTENRWLGITGGVGSGKSDAGVVWHWQRSRLNCDSQFSWVIAPTYGKLWDSIVPRFVRVLEGFGYIKNVHYRILASPLVYLTFLYSGHQVHFHGADRPDLMVATEISHCLIDEPGRMKGQVFTEVNERLRCPRALCRQILCTGVPQGINSYSEMFDF